MKGETANQGTGPSAGPSGLEEDAYVGIVDAHEEIDDGGDDLTLATMTTSFMHGPSSASCVLKMMYHMTGPNRPAKSKAPTSHYYDIFCGY
jgi:hypothetical protein